MTNTAIRKEVDVRGITRLCHFTPSRNLVHIATDPRGLLATKHLLSDERAAFNSTDLERMDGQLDHICCSVQYPNAWYFRKARSEDKVFKDWVVLLIASECLFRNGVKFCPRNAAAGRGRYLGESIDAFRAMFAETVEGAGNRRYTRGPNHPGFLPTDEQAEVLIPDNITPSEVLGLAVADASQARREQARFRLLKADAPPIYIAPSFFDAVQLSRLLRAGKTPEEATYLG